MSETVEKKATYNPKEVEDNYYKLCEERGYFEIDGNKSIQEEGKDGKIKTFSIVQIPAGDHSYIWNGENDLGKPVSSGIYFYRLNVNGKAEVTRKCLLLKWSSNPGCS